MNKTKYIFVTILLGALGSAFWEMCLKRLVQLIIDTLMPYLLQCFNDSFYTRVAHSLNAPAFETFIFFMYILGILFIVPPKFFEKYLYSLKEDKAERILQNVLKLTCFLAVMYQLLTVAIATNTARAAINNIDIVAPYITDLEYKQLRSDFFQMNSKSDYQSLVEKLESIAEEYSLQLR